MRIRSSSGYASRDPQGGTSDGSVCKLSLKIIFFFLFTMVYDIYNEKVKNKCGRCKTPRGGVNRCYC